MIYEKWKCQKCGESIGYLGRFFQFFISDWHVCEINNDDNINHSDKFECDDESEEQIICNFCGKTLKEYWAYMPGNENYCDECVPRGCSCNEESFYFEDGCYSKEKQIEDFLKYRHLKILNYGNKIHNIGKHLEEITDYETIKTLFYNLSEEQLLHFGIRYLDDKGREWPCCEYNWFEAKKDY